MVSVSFLRCYFGFKQSKVDPCLYKKVTNLGITLLAIYVDGLLIASNSYKDSIYVIVEFFVSWIFNENSRFPELFLGVQIAQNLKGLIGYFLDSNCQMYMFSLHQWTPTNNFQNWWMNLQDKMEIINKLLGA